MRPPRWSSLIFVAGVLLVLAALGWATFHALRLERLEQEARAQAHFQESIRLALWRMDSKITPIIAREAARPYFQYRPFYPADRAYTRMLNQVEPGEVMVPSPLLQTLDPFVKLHFERGPGGTLSSPQVPTGQMRTLAEGTYVTGYAVVTSRQLLERLDDLFSPKRQVMQDDAAVRLQKQLKETGQLSSAAPEELGDQVQEQKKPGQVQTQQPTPRQSGEYQQQLNQSATEYANRQRNMELAQQNAPPSGGRASPSPSSPAAAGAPAPAPAAEPTVAAGNSKDEKSDDSEKNKRKDSERLAAKDAPAPTKPSDEFAKKAPASKAAPAARDSDKGVNYLDMNSDGAKTPDVTPLLVGGVEAGVVQGQFAPSWVLNTQPGASELVYTREVEAGTTHLTQGFWVDWPALRQSLLADTGDLLPGATLVPVDASSESADPAILGRTLAALPALLVAPEPVLPPAPVWSPVRSTLLATWIATLGAMIAIALVLRASMELAERRGRFVSAVTHELRTPLTTFCLYSQMLADGMVKSEEAQKTYFDTLRSESTRLARIVESVLDYARLGRNRHTTGHARVPTHELLDKIVPNLKVRCDQAGMELVVEDTSDAAAAVQADPATLERILFNLVDNACKYASNSEDKRVHLTIASTARDLTISVRDHGPGLERHEQRRIFRPFVRGHKQADGSIPGLGLGLALSQGLAGELHGELKSVPSDSGAEFRLRIPLA